MEAINNLNKNTDLRNNMISYIVNSKSTSKMSDKQYDALENKLLQKSFAQLKKEYDTLKAKNQMKNGGGIDMYSKFDFNKSGNFFATINNKNYEIIYRDDKSQMYDLFENDKKIKSSKNTRDLMYFPKKYAKGSTVKGDIVFTNKEVYDNGEVVDSWASDIGGSNESQDNIVEYKGDKYLVSINVEDNEVIRPKAKALIYEQEYAKGSTVKGDIVFTNKEVYDNGEVVDSWASDIGGSNESQDNIVEYKGDKYLVSINVEDNEVIRPKAKALIYEQEYAKGSTVKGGFSKGEMVFIALTNQKGEVVNVGSNWATILLAHSKERKVFGFDEIEKLKDGGGVSKEKVFEVAYYGKKHLKQRGSSKGNYKTWVVAINREEAIEKVKNDDDEFAELKSAKPTNLDVERYKMKNGGGIDINELNMPVIRTQFEDEEYEFKDGGTTKGFCYTIGGL